MIPRHSLPFRVSEFLPLLFSAGSATRVPDLEKAYAEALEARAVLLIPSVRAGIHMAIRAACGPRPLVIGPAYTCDSVREALAQSGAQVRFVDSGPDSFLMSAEAMNAASEPGCALLLGEVYGIPYDLDEIGKSYSASRLRVFDRAMCVPTPGMIQPLKAGDVALYSCGWGKPMYAGWGGFACLQDTDLAEKMRGIRDAWLGAETAGLRFKRLAAVLLRVAINQRELYGLWHERHLYGWYKSAVRRRQAQNPRSSRLDGLSTAPARSAVLTQDRQSALSDLPDKWTRPTTPLNRSLAMYNLRNAPRNATVRRAQSEIYVEILVNSGIVPRTDRGALPQSHFPIRIPAAFRDRLCDYLRGRRLDTSTLWPFAEGLGRERYPQAARAADEVITLPLGPTMTLDEVRMSANCVVDGLRELGFDTRRSALQ